MTTPAINPAWRPRGALGWLLTLVAAVLALATGALAFYMLCPSDWNGPGRLGALALFFPLHLLPVALGFGCLGLLAWRLRAKLAAGLLVAAALACLLLGLWPSLAVWQLAREEGVPLSLATYRAHAGSLNLGAPQPERSLAYATLADGSELLLDLWRADGAAAGSPRPAIVFVHGGAWTHGTRSSMPAWNRWLNGLGYDVFDVEYRLAPPARWQEEVGDVKCAIGWVAAHAEEYGIDPTRISAMGYSAGGNLAMLAAYSLGDARLPPSCPVAEAPLRSVVNLYGPGDMGLLYDSSGSQEYIRDALRKYIGGTPQQYAERYRLLSPVQHVSARTPPTISFLGRSDRIIPRDQAETLDQAFARAGVRHETWLLPASDHGFDASWGSFPAQFARAKLEAFLRRH
ncbi:alpha/beta hydrolase fold protein [compost metagenome]